MQNSYKKGYESMKKLICIAAVLAISLTLACPAFAAEDTFVPSISYKDGPAINQAVMGEEDVAGCLVVTSLKGAADKTTDISQEARDLLLDVYAKLDSGEMELPLEEGYIIRELVDVSWKQSACEDAGHAHKAEHEKEGVTVSVDFDLGIDADDGLLVYAYRSGEWKPIEAVTVNSDGTVTCVFEHFCPVVFCFKDNTDNDPTGDITSESLLLWFVLMAVSVAAIVVMTADRRKHMR